MHDWKKQWDQAAADAGSGIDPFLRALSDRALDFRAAYLEAVVAGQLDEGLADEQGPEAFEQWADERMVVAYPSQKAKAEAKSETSAGNWRYFDGESHPVAEDDWTPLIRPAGDPTEEPVEETEPATYRDAGEVGTTIARYLVYHLKPASK